MIKKTKIVCTVGPGTDKPGILERMLEAGMNVARFNFSHGTHADHARRMAMVREAAQKVDKPVALLLDTKGPEIRIGKFTDGKVFLQQGQKFILTTREILGSSEIVSVSHKLLPQEVVPGGRILLADGLIGLEVQSATSTEIVTTVCNSGEISNLKRVAVPDVSVNLPFLSEQDVADILFGIQHDMDFIAASFVQRAADVLSIRKILEDHDAKMDIIAKTENAEGVNNFDEILKVVDGIMVARGDLGIEIPTEEVPLVQKSLIAKSNRAGKPVITATQMLESMIANPRPTRAEASDIANAIMDGSDAIMLSGETASGNYPVEAVETMAKIAIRTETALSYRDLLLSRGLTAQRTTTDAISHATVQVAHELGASAIITSTHSGYTARMVSKYRPQAAIVAVTPLKKTLRRMLLLWGVQPVLGAGSNSTDEMVTNVINGALSTGIVRDGDMVVVTAGVPLGTAGTTNMIRVHVVGNILVRGTGIGQKILTGKACVARSASDVIHKLQAGDILVVPALDEENSRYAEKAAAIIAEENGLTSPAAILGVSYGIPVIVGAEGAIDHIADGATLTIDAMRGVVYQGEIKAK